MSAIAERFPAGNIDDTVAVTIIGDTSAAASIARSVTSRYPADDVHDTVVVTVVDDVPTQRPLPSES